MDEWHIGDPVDWGDGFMDAQNWGHQYDDDEDEPPKEPTVGNYIWIMMIREH